MFQRKQSKSIGEQKKRGSNPRNGVYPPKWGYPLKWGYNPRNCARQRLNDIHRPFLPLKTVRLQSNGGGGLGYPTCGKTWSTYLQVRRMRRNRTKSRTKNRRTRMTRKTPKTKMKKTRNLNGKMNLQVTKINQKITCILCSSVNN